MFTLMFICANNRIKNNPEYSSEAVQNYLSEIRPYSEYPLQD